MAADGGGGADDDAWQPPAWVSAWSSDSSDGESEDDDSLTAVARRWAALDMTEDGEAEARPQRARRRRRRKSAGSSLFQRLAKTNDGLAPSPSAPSQSAAASRPAAARREPRSAGVPRSRARVPADTAPAPAPELSCDGVSASTPWLRLHADHSVDAKVVAKVADDQPLTYIDSFTLHQANGRAVHWLKFSVEDLDHPAQQGWALKSELALRNAQPSPDSVEGFLRASHVHNHSASHTLRGAGVDNVEELALLDEAELEGVGLSQPERRILARALRKYAEDAPEAADAAEEQVVEPAAQEPYAQHSPVQRPQSAATPQRPGDFFGGARTPSAFGSRPSTADWQRRSLARDRPSTAPALGMDGMRSAPRSQQGFRGTKSAGEQSLLGRAAVAAVARRPASAIPGIFPADHRRFSGGGFALKARETAAETESLSSGSAPSLGRAVSYSAQHKESLAHVVLSSSSAVLEDESDAAEQLRGLRRGGRSKPWLDVVATTKSLQRTNKARRGVNTPSSFGGVGQEPRGPPMRPASAAFRATKAVPKELPRARAGNVWCATEGIGAAPYTQMSPQQRQDWLDGLMGRGMQAPRQVDPSGQPLPTTARDEAKRIIGAGQSSQKPPSGRSFLLDDARAARDAQRPQNRRVTKNVAAGWGQRRKARSKSGGPAMVWGGARDLVWRTPIST